MEEKLTSVETVTNVLPGEPCPYCSGDCVSVDDSDGVCYLKVSVQLGLENQTRMANEIASLRGLNVLNTDVQTVRNLLLPGLFTMGTSGPCDLTVRGDGGIDLVVFEKRKLFSQQEIEDGSYKRLFVSRVKSVCGLVTAP